MDSKKLEKLNEYLNTEFDIWWETEAEAIALNCCGDEVNWNAMYKLCEIAWSNGAYVTKLWIKEND